MKELFDTYLDKRFYRCLEGRVAVAQSLCSLKFDLILFTGSNKTGRMVAQSAANNLVPCVLELGGKCPVIVDETCKLEPSVRRILLARFANSGQACIAADHIYVHKSIKAKFMQKLLSTLKEFYGESLDNQIDMGKIINKTHMDRLEGYLKEDHGGKVLAGGKIDHNKMFIQPTIIEGPNLDSSMMTEEIFGPILPVL